MPRVESQHSKTSKLAKTDPLATDKDVSESLTKPTNLKEYRAYVKRLTGHDIKKTSFAKFAKLYVKERGLQWSDFYHRICSWVDKTESKPRRMLMAYRGAGKSSYAVQLYSCYLLWRNPSTTILIVSAAEPLAVRNSGAIKEMIETFTLTKHLKPEKPEYWATTGLRVDRFNVDQSDSITCLGLGANVAGWRAHITMFDDCEQPENAGTEEEREKLRNRMMQFLMMSTQQLYVGTYQSSKSVYLDLQAEADFEFVKFPIWKDEAKRITQNPNVTVIGVKQDAKWADRMAKLPSATWISQFLLEPSDMRKTRFNTNLIKWFNLDFRIEKPPRRTGNPALDKTRWFVGEGNETELYHWRAYWDPASGGKHRDDSVLTIRASTLDGRIFVFERITLPAVDENKSFYNQCEMVVDFASQYQLSKVYVEANFALMLANQLRETAKKRGRYLQVENVTRTTGKMNFIPQHVEPPLKAETLYLHERVKQTRSLLSQIREFSPNMRHDDAIDRLAGSLSQLEQVRKPAGLERPQRELHRFAGPIRFNRAYRG